MLVIINTVIVIANTITVIANTIIVYRRHTPYSLTCGSITLRRSVGNGRVGITGAPLVAAATVAPNQGVVTRGGGKGTVGTVGTVCVVGVWVCGCVGV